MAARPNILLIMTDQQRYDSLGCYGSRVVPTPSLDRLAAEGTLFETCTVNNPLCTPSRASMMTGKHLTGHGLYRLYDDLPDSEILFTERLQGLGYETALIGKLHVCSRTLEGQKRHPHDGFDIYEWSLDPRVEIDSEFNAYSQWLNERDPDLLERLRHKGEHVPRELHFSHWAADRTIAYLESAAQADRPFFCKMSLFDPHGPYDDYPEGFENLVDPEFLPDPVIVEDEYADLPILDRLSLGSGTKPSDRTPEKNRAIRTGYFASIALADMEIGRVMATLDRVGLKENTLVIFLSDHGDMLGDHLQYAKGGFFYDPCIRVPFILSWPGKLPGGRRNSELVQPHDVAATCLSAAGMPAAEIASIMPDSVDLVPICSDESRELREYAVCLYRNSGLTFPMEGSYYQDPPVIASVIRDKRHKLIVYHGESQGQLFDMEEDPMEKRNLWTSESHSQIRLTLTQELLDWLTRQEIQELGSRGGSSNPPWWDPVANTRVG